MLMVLRMFCAINAESMEHFIFLLEKSGFEVKQQCEKRSSYKVGIVDRVNDLCAMAWAVASKLFCEGFNFGIVG